MDSKKYILCIDDDEDDCSLLAEALHGEKPAYRLHAVKSGDLALQFLADALQNNDLPELIVLDINMPAMDGKETLVQIKKLLGGLYVPVLFLTTTPREEDLLFGEVRGVTIMAKPKSMKGYGDLAKTIFDSLLQ